MKNLKKLLYGREILRSIQRDDLLRKADSPDGLKVEFEYPLNENDRDLWRMLCHMRQYKLIDEWEQGLWRTTEEGKDFLASGGYVGEVKRQKAAVRALRVSIAALFISFITFLASFFGWFGRQ